jgi:cytochrome c553
MRILRYLAVSMMVLGLNLAFAQEEAVDLNALLDECQSCHGPGGVSDQEDIPTLAGTDVETLLKALDQFYYYERHCPTTTYRHGDKPKTPMNMCNIASSLSDQEKRALAEYFASR